VHVLGKESLMPETHEESVRREALVWIEIIKEAIAIFEKHGGAFTSQAYTSPEQVEYWSRQDGGVLATLKGIDYEWEEYVILKNHEIYFSHVPRYPYDQNVDFSECRGLIELKPDPPFHLKFIAEECVKGVWTLGLDIANVKSRAPGLNLSGGTVRKVT